MADVVIPPLPAKVLRKAAELGTHEACISEGILSSCEACVRCVFEAFDFFYSEVPSDKLLERLIADASEE